MFTGETQGDLPLLRQGSNFGLDRTLSDDVQEEGRGRQISADTTVEQPTLERFDTGLANPWDHPDWSREELIEYVKRERGNMEALFGSVIGPKTPISATLMKRPAVSLTFKDMAYSIPLPGGNQKTILEPCSGHVEPGQLVAVMGPSGCGKSTLLDMLANKKTSKYTGTVLINGRPRDKFFQRVASYVGQEDVMPQHWKVREAVQFNWDLKTMPTKISEQVLQKAPVDLLLAAFGLTGVADTYIGGPAVRGISGGQRRRVTLARGVASRGALLFCDEPTSGLSATDAELCVRSLRIIAKKFRVLIMVVIHQPRVEVASLFDSLFLLTSSPGRVVYNGPMDGALQYWKDCGHSVPEFANPTDVYLDYVTPGGPKDHVDQFVRMYNERLKPGVDSLVEQSMMPERLGETVPEMLRATHAFQEAAGLNPGRLRVKKFALPFWKQLAILFRRKLILTGRNPANIRMPIMVPVLVGILMGVMYTDIGSKGLQQQVSFVFMLLTRICMGGMQLMPGLIEERIIMKYDTSETLYSVQAFIIVGIAIDITVALIGAVLNCIIMYSFAGLAWKYFGLIITWAILNFFVFDAFFGFVAAAAPTLQIAQVAAIPFNSIFMMFSGFMISKESAPSFLKWVFQISPLGYAIQSIFVNMADDFPTEGPVVIKVYGFEEGQEAQGVAILLTMMVVLRMLQVVSLQYLNNIQK
jgi:ATP-binding cassette subfamily G (WHITE) protein 2